MSERGLSNELLSGVGLKVWTMCLQWSWSSVEKKEGGRGRKEGGMEKLERRMREGGERELLNVHRLDAPMKIQL